LDWLLYILVFIFGYTTCKTFYFLSATRTSINLIRITQLISLMIFSKSLEHFAYAKSTRLHIMKQNEESEHNINAFVETFDQEVDAFKFKGIKTIVNYHSSRFKDLLEFDDWKTAMKYLDDNKEIVFKFLIEEHSDN
jgi:hypothetical protein